MSDRETTLTIRRLLDAHGRLTVEARRLREEDDLFERGLTCLAAVDVMLAMEQAFGVAFPSQLLTRESARSLAALRTCVERAAARPIAA